MIFVLTNVLALIYGKCLLKIIFLALTFYVLWHQTYLIFEVFGDLISMLNDFGCYPCVTRNKDSVCYLVPSGFKLAKSQQSDRCVKYGV